MYELKHSGPHAIPRLAAVVRRPDR
jgi:hypothetical protein